MRGITTFMVLQDTRDECNKTADPFRRRVSPQPENLFPMQCALLGHLFGIEPRHLVIWDAHDMPTRVSNPRRTQAYGHYRALVPFGSDRIAYLEGPIQQNHEAAE